ncbi:UDP-glucose:undecaprenyl-phosphate glucose-1-phosphate transferase [Hartmannibacter diazotrophicus]|uniref:UDP-glucose:undecaprenyl-phosphate glucose-1-phosphate transferase n=1 Tax=Hartmannibacter diazotrophicus TaxID=1482074 RepID=A0A2C9DCU5_9HYPH|nr:sugar transferase [Hartmannibacter diazotrophicus]SON58053.1 UDP-glucose:undecaprenyl-phosphate glucose-1-phosphate transferase [Hartmannibacter diazotrophicus]
MSFVQSIAKSEQGQVLRGPVGGVTKRVADVCLTIPLIIFFSPLCLLIAAIIWLSDPGPIFFGHERIGLGGRKFRCLKFRSMVTNSREVLDRLLDEDPAARAEWDQTQKLRNDPRITVIGRILRETSLDELPQLINVLRGDMSLVGPRPVVKDELARYGANLCFYEMVRPGITGLWQVSGRSNCSYEQRVQYDVDYVCDWSLLQDIKILFRTAKVVLCREGSY